jgi:hypothetical protein
MNPTLILNLVQINLTLILVLVLMNPPLILNLVQINLTLILILVQMNPTLILNLVQINLTLILILVLMNPPLILILIPTNAVPTFPFNVFRISFNVILFNYGKYTCCLEFCNSSLVFFVAFAISMAVPVPVCDCSARLLLISTLLITFHLLISFN